MLFISSYKFLTKFQIRNASTIGFIGLGNMGSRMANNLIKKGNTLKIYDISPNTQIKGALVCKTPEEASENCSTIITMLPDGAIVSKTVSKILPNLKNNATFIDCSTIEPHVAQSLHQLLAEQKQIKFLDAPVSGGIKGAEAGSLTFMVGGYVEHFKEAEPILLQMGSKALHCGKPGAGQVAKLCNNLILGVTMIATAEGMNLGAKLGLDPKLLASIVNCSTGRSWSSDTYNPVPGIMEGVPSSNDYQGGFAVKLMAKDLGLAENAAVHCNAAVPLGAIAHQLYRTMMANGLENKDFSAIYKFLKGNEV